MLRNIKILRNCCHEAIIIGKVLARYSVISATLKEISSHFSHHKNKYVEILESLKRGVREISRSIEAWIKPERSEEGG